MKFSKISCGDSLCKPGNGVALGVGSGLAVQRPQGIMQSNPKLIFIFVVLLDFFYWTLNSRLMFTLNEFSLTYTSFIVLFLISCSILNKKLLYLYLFFLMLQLFFVGSLDGFKSTTILFCIIQLAIKLKKICINEKFINLMLFIILIEVFLIFYFGEVLNNVFGENEFFTGLSGSYKLLMYSLSVPLFVLGLCVAHTKSIFKIIIILTLFNIIFYMIFKSYARAGLLYIFFWLLYLAMSFYGKMKYIIIFASVSFLIFLFNRVNLDIIYFLTNKGYSGRDELFFIGLQHVLNNPLHFIFGMPGGASSAAFKEDLLLPDLGSLFISFYDYGIFGLCIFLLFISKFIHNFINNINKTTAPIFIFGFISIIDVSGSNFFAFSTPSTLILWAVLINKGNFINSSGLVISSARKYKF